MPTPTRSPLAKTRRVRTWILASLGWMMGLSLVVPYQTTAVWAQDQKKQAAKAEAPAVEKTDDAASKESAAAQDATASQPKKAAPKSFLQWAWEASGYIGAFLVLISIVFTALVISLFMELRVSEAVPAALVDNLENLIKERKFQEAYDVCREDNSVLARLVRTGVANLPNGRAEAKEAMNTLSDEIVVTMESRISYLATIGTLGPMIGLVGTIWGMIHSFQEIATAGGQPQADKVAEGISTALFITLEGVSLSVPAIFFFAFFRNRIAVIAMESAKVAERTINAFWNAAKQTPAAGGGAGAAKPQAPTVV